MHISVISRRNTDIIPYRRAQIKRGDWRDIDMLEVGGHERIDVAPVVVEGAGVVHAAKLLVVRKE